MAVAHKAGMSPSPSFRYLSGGLLAGMRSTTGTSFLAENDRSLIRLSERRADHRRLEP